MTTTAANLPPNALRLLSLYHAAARDWADLLPLEVGDVELLGARADRRLLSHLESARLVYTAGDGDGIERLYFTAEGTALAEVGGEVASAFAAEVLK
jgi:hypothetical protein